MESIDYWRLCDEFNICQAALLIAGEDPSHNQYYVEGWSPENRPAGYEAAKMSLKNAISTYTLTAKIRYQATGFIELLLTTSSLQKAQGKEAVEIEGRKFLARQNIDWGTTTVNREDLCNWLKVRGFNDGFFFIKNAQASLPNYINSLNENYSPKLAAAIEAWQAISSQPELSKAKSVKQAIVIWLRTNAGKFGLIKDDGLPNENGIEEVAKVVNWETKGGAPKTP